MQQINWTPDKANSISSATGRLVVIPLGETHIRSKFSVTIVGVKRAGEDFTHATAETVIQARMDP